MASPTASRRTLLGLAALAAVPAPALAAQLAPNPDAELIRLGTQEAKLAAAFNSIADEAEAMVDEQIACGFKLPADRQLALTESYIATDAAWDRWQAVRLQVRAALAATPRGLAVKVREMARYYEEREGESEIDALTRAHLAEVLAFCEPHG